MEDAELVGGILLASPDIRAAARALVELLEAEALDPAKAQVHGLEPELVAVLRTRFKREQERICEVCALGAAWAMGRASTAVAGAWELVASWPSGESMPQGLRRTTGETLIYLITSAVRRIRLVAPFMDESGVGYLVDALAAATRRNVSVELFVPTRSTHCVEAIAALGATVGRAGNPRLLSNVAFRSDAPWAHLKVMTTDGLRAYLGSANFTGPALGGANLELGVLLDGEQVHTIDSALLQFREQ